MKQQIRREPELWNLFIAGDQEAFSELYLQCYRRLFSYATALGMDRAMCEDAIHDLFFRLCNKPSLVRDSRTIMAMMYAAVRNYYFYTLRKTNRHIDFDEAGTGFDFSYSIDEALTSAEDHDKIKRQVGELLSVLNPRQKEVIYLRYFLDLDYDAIGSIMEVPESAARSILSRAIRKIRKNDPTAYMALLFISMCYLNKF